MDMSVGRQRRLRAKELMLLKCGTRENSGEFLGHKEIKPVDPKGNQPWIFTGKTDAKAEGPVWPSEAKSQLIGKGTGVGKDWRQKEKEVGRGWDH